MDHIDVDRVLSTLGVVAGATTADQVLGAVLASTVALVSADSAVATDIGPSRGRVRTWPDDFLSVEQLRTIVQLNQRDPLTLSTHTRLGSGYPLRISDPFSQRHDRRPDIYGELFRALGCDHQVAFSIPIGHDRRICVAITRQCCDYSEAEIERLQALRQPLSACASHLPPPHGFDLPEIDSIVDLSPRQCDVLGLIATGLSNAQIGRRLGISARTVNKHLEHIFAKTGLNNRTQAAGYWQSLGRQRTN